MASLQESLTWIYELQDNVTSPLRNIQGALGDVHTINEQIRQEFNFTIDDQATAATKRQSLIEQELADLAELKERRKAAHTVTEIQDYNNRISETEQRITTLKDAQIAAATEGQSLFASANEAAKRRSQLLKQEQADLKELERRKKSAFTVTEINKYNQKIAETRQRIETLKNAHSSSLGFISKGWNSLGNTVKGFIGIYAGMATISGLTSFVSSSAKAWDEEMKAHAKVRASLASTGFAAGKTFEDLQKAASNMQSKTLFGDEKIMMGQATLLGFKNIKGDVFDQVTAMSADMAEHLKMDFDSAAKLLGSALNEPERAIRKLRDAGLSFSDSQEKAFEKLIKQGKTQEAQILILDELYGSIGGKAEAAAKSGLGPWTQMVNRFGDLKERIGGGVISITSDLVPAFNWLIDVGHSAIEMVKDFVAWTKENEAVLKTLAVGIGVAATATLIYTGYLKGVALWQGILLAVQNPLIFSTTALGAAVNFLFAPVTLIIGGIALLAAGVYYAWENFEGFRGTVYGIIEVFKELIPIAEALAQILLGILTFNPVVIASGISRVIDAYKEMDLSAAFDRGMEKGVGGFREEKDEKETKKRLKEEEKAGVTEEDREQAAKHKMSVMDYMKSDLRKEFLAIAAATEKKKTDQSITKSLDSVVSGGGKEQVKNINMTIQSLVKEIKIYSSSVKESTSNIKDEITKALIAAVHDTEQALSGS